jgi:hypothetical protein
MPCFDLLSECGKFPAGEITAGEDYMSDREKKKKVKRTYHCKNCQAILSVGILSQHEQKLYEMPEDAPAIIDGRKAEQDIWTEACSLLGTFTSRELYDKCQKLKEKPTFNTVRYYVQKWSNAKQIRDTGEKRPVPVIVCESCGSQYDTYSLAGSIKTRKSVAAAKNNLKKYANPKVKPKYANLVWEGVILVSEPFTPQEVHTKCKDVKLRTVRHYLHKWASEGKLRLLDGTLGHYDRAPENDEKRPRT